jgi:PEGA domain
LLRDLEPHCLPFRETSVLASDPVILRPTHPRPTHRAGCATLIALVVFSIGMSWARAADPGEVEELLRQGIALRRVGNDNQALPFFTKAYAMSPIPRTAAQLGLVEMALGYQLDAERHLTEGLSAPRDFWIQKHRDILEQSLKSVLAAIGEIAIEGSPKGAEVSVNGKLVGQLPLSASIRLAEGPAAVEVRARGYVAQTASIKVTGTKREQVTMNLQQARPVAAPALAAAAPREPAGRAVENNSGTTEESDSSSPGEASPAPGRDVDSGGGGSALRPIAWVTAAAAVAGIGFGVFETVRWRDKRDQFDHVTTASASDPAVLVAACGTDEPRRGSLSVCQNLYTDMNQAKTLAIVGFAVSGGLAVGSVILFLASQKPGRPAKDSAIACAPVGSFTNIACRLTF